MVRPYRESILIPAKRARRALKANVAEWESLQNPHTVTSDCKRVMVHRFVMPFTAMADPQPSARVAVDPRTVRLALELLERTAGRRRRCRCCRSVIAENGETVFRLKGERAFEVDVWTFNRRCRLL